MPEVNEEQSLPFFKPIWAIFMLAFMVFQVLSFITYNPFDISFYTTSPNTPVLNYCGILGAYFTFAMVFSFGFASVILPFFSASLAWRLIRGDGWMYFLKWFLYLQISLISLSSIFTLSLDSWATPFLKTYQTFSAGGLVGKMLGAELCIAFIGKWASLFIFMILFLFSLQGIISFSYRTAGGMLLKSSILLLQYTQKLLSFLWAQCLVFGIWLIKKMKFSEHSDLLEDEEQERAPIIKTSPDSMPSPLENLSQEKEPDSPPPSPVKPQPLTTLIKSLPLSLRKRKEEKPVSEANLLRKKTGQWVFPTLQYLNEPQSTSLDLEENIQANAAKLVQTLNEFDVQSEVVGIESGPVITRYEIQIASGIKVQKVVSLDNDIGLAMRAKSVRIIAPIPGKSAIGIEIPNQIRKMVFFKELLVSQEFKNTKAEIPMVLGKDISGRPVIADLAAMPHLLIAGATGAGKSVCINTIVMSLLYTLSPSEVKIMMVDPKKVELAMYKSLPHLFVPLITNPNKVAQGLRCLIEEMERRYQIFKEAQVRNIQGYNKKDKTALREQLTSQESGIDPMEAFPERMTYIVAVIDELADLMLVAKSEIESSIVRLAQLSRAVGIHLILATQRPSVDVVTGLIKANVPARIAFRVSAKVDSRTVLDTSGAEKLLGRGDMLFLNPGDIDLNRLQGAYLEDNEINAVVEHWNNQGEPEYDDLAMSMINHSEATGGEPEDPLFHEAVEAIRLSKQASTSFLQKKFRIGYNRASRLIDELENKGIIGPPSAGGKTREIYLEGAEDAPFSPDKKNDNLLD